MPEPGGAAWQWQLSSLSQLRTLRADLRTRLHAAGGRASDEDSAGDRLLLAVDELASNGLRHGLPPVTARVLPTEGGWLIIVSDRATERRPEQAVDRDPARGGMGLYLVAELTTGRGWDIADGHKHVWAILAAAP